MKRKNQFILIGVIVIIIFIFLIDKLLNLRSPISEKHIGVKFEIHNCSSVENNPADLRENFLRPLLEYNIVQKKTETIERLYLPKVASLDKEFCIPAIGINSVRYDSKTKTLQESTMTSTSREGDQDAFFSNWNGGVDLSELEQNLLKSNPKSQQNPSLNEIKKIDKLDVIFIDSFIIDKNCSDQVIEYNKPYIFRSTRDLRNYINKELEKNPNAIETGTVNKTIHIFIYCGAGEYLLNKNDRDNDGVNNEFDACPDLPGEKANKGCPIKEDIDGDGVYAEDDSCPKEKGDKACDGCPCPPCADRDRDGICDDKDKCPDERGDRKYNGCPDKDKDGIPDYKDECPEEFGILKYKGCPAKDEEDEKPSVSINLKEPHFLLNGDELKDGYKVVIIFKLRNGKTKDFSTDDNKFPSNHNEGNTIFNSLGENTSGLKISFELWKDNNKIKDIKSFSNISLICKINGECGFKQF
jgi:hypothetical protein